MTEGDQLFGHLDMHMVNATHEHELACRPQMSPQQEALARGGKDLGPVKTPSGVGSYSHADLGEVTGEDIGFMARACHPRLHHLGSAGVAVGHVFPHPRPLVTRCADPIRHLATSGTLVAHAVGGLPHRVGLRHLGEHG